MGAHMSIMQVDAEIDAFAEILARENIKSYLEIGSKFGGSLMRVAKFAGSRRTRRLRGSSARHARHGHRARRN
jgi:cephalosporin hydroxylase